MTIGQLRAAGLTDSAVGKRVKRGVLHREYRGIPVTSVARLLVDMTDVSDVGEIANLIHEAAFLGRFSELATRDAMERANGRHNLRVLEQALTAHIEGSAGTKSRKERAFKRLIEAAGLPTPQSNVHVEGIEVDLFWPNRKLCAEVDGSGHGRRPTRREDATSRTACSPRTATRCCGSPTRRSSDRRRRRSLDSRHASSPATCSARPCR